MERDVLANARAEKERLMREFYTGVVTQINELIRDVTGNMLESLEEHEGVLRGPISNQLRNLVTQLDQLNFMDDRTLMQQIERLQSVISSQAESEQARKGLARIDTSLMQRVVRQVHDAANEVLISLEVAAGPRKARQGETPLDDGHLIDLGARKARPAAASFKKVSGKSAKPRTHRGRSKSVAAFEFYTMSEEDQATLQKNPRRCVALLRPCKPLADKLAATGSIYAPLSVDDERLLQGFHLVQQSHEGYEYEGAFDQLCQQAGLLHSDVGLLGGRVQTLFQQREPALYEAEAYSILHQWLRNKSGENEE